MSERSEAGPELTQAPKDTDALAGFVALAAILTSLYALFMLLAWLYTVPSSLATLSWPETSGSIQQAYASSGGCSGKSNLPGFSLKYTYSYGGTLYTGDQLGSTRWYYTNYTDCGLKIAEELRLARRENRPVPVYVNASDPQQAILMRGFAPFGAAGRSLVVTAVLWLIAYAINSMPGKPERRPIAPDSATAD